MPALILVVEDEPAIQSLIEVNLRRAGFDVLLAGDAEVAQKLINTLKDGQFLFAWYPDPRWAGASGYQQCPLTAGHEPPDTAGAALASSEPVTPPGVMP